ncbi:MAG: hypothetical protein ABEH78_04760 [Haloferacaceae archaeon]
MSERSVTHERTIDRDASDPHPHDPVATLSAVVVLIGGTVVLQAVQFDPAPAQFWSEAVVGSVLVAVGGYNYYRRATDRLGSVAAAAVVALLGLWLMASSFAFGADPSLAATVDTFGFWDGLFSGQLALVLGVDSAVKTCGRHRDVREPAD